MSRVVLILVTLLGAIGGCGPAAPSDAPPSRSFPARDWRDEVIYQIVVDRFDDADPSNNTINGVSVVPGDLARHQGGDWAGVRRRLGYIERLGATAIWLSPLVANVDRTEDADGYHGYWASDFTEPNPRFGTTQELAELVAEAHTRGLRVVADAVLNHAGRVFYYDLDGSGTADPGEVLPRFFEDGPFLGSIRWIDGQSADAAPAAHGSRRRRRSARSATLPSARADEPVRGRRTKGAR